MSMPTKDLRHCIQAAYIVGYREAAQRAEAWLDAQTQIDTPDNAPLALAEHAQDGHIDGDDYTTDWLEQAAAY